MHLITVQLIKNNKIEKTVESDEDGIYFFEDIIPGNYDVKVDLLKYYLTSKKAIAIIDETTFLNFSIQADQSIVSLQGKVLDSSSLKPILFGTVALKQNGSIVKGVETNFDGHYYFEDILPGVYDIKASYVGYTPSEIRNVRVFSNLVNIQNIMISEGIVNIEDISFSCGFRSPMIKFDDMESGRTFTSEDIKRMPICK